MLSTFGRPDHNHPYTKGPVMVSVKPIPANARFQDLTGKTFDRLTVIGYAGLKNKNRFWLCRCSCGNIRVTAASSLTEAAAKGYGISCGCIRRDKADPDLLFWMRTKKVGDCIEWQGARTRQGYGQVTIGRAHLRSHRYAYEQCVGPIGDLMVCHKCDNPACVRPEHLFLGTAKDNVRDMVSKDRHLFGEKGNGAKLTETQAKEIIHRRIVFNISAKEIAAEYKLDEATVRSIVRGSTWTKLSAWRVESRAIRKTLVAVKLCPKCQGNGFVECRDWKDGIA